MATSNIDPNIILSGIARSNSPQFDPVELARLKTQMDQAKLQQVATQFEMQRAQKSDMMQDELRSVLSQGGTPEQLYENLLRGGHLKEATEFQKSTAANKSAQLEQQTKIGGLIKQGATAVLANPTEQNAIQVINQLEQMTGHRMDNDKAAIMSLRGDPNAIRRWAAGHALEAEKLLPKTETQDLGGQVETRQIDPLTGQPTGQVETRQKTMTPDQIEGNKIARGNLSVSQQRLALDQSKNERESVAQQKLDLKMAEDERKAGVKERETLQTVDNTLSKLDQILGGEGKEGMVNQGTAGLIGKVSSFIPQTPAYNLEKKIDSVKAALGFDTLQAMRDASPTGGALGQVAVRELEFLQAKVASLDVGQSPSQLKQHLQEVQAHYKKWRAAVEASSRGQTEATKPTSFNSMPDPSKYSGKRIKSDDGTIYKSNGSSWVRQ